MSKQTTNTGATIMAEAFVLSDTGSMAGQVFVKIIVDDTHAVVDGHVGGSKYNKAKMSKAEGRDVYRAATRAGAKLFTRGAHGECGGCGVDKFLRPTGKCAGCSDKRTSKARFRRTCYGGRC